MDQNLAYVTSGAVRDESRSYFSKIGFEFRRYHDVNTELASGKTMADIHKEYGIKDNTIRTWSGAFIAVADLTDAGRRDQVLKGLKIPAL